MPELPKFSQILANFTAPEKQFEEMVSRTGMPSPPPGPMSVMMQVAQSVESTAPAGLPELPAPAGLPELPAFPELFGGGAGESASEFPVSEKSSGSSEGIDF